MKKVLISILTIVALLIVIYVLQRNLPLTISRRSDIKLGEEIIKKVEAYKKMNGLPRNGDWKTLRTFGFRDEGLFLQPEYSRIDNQTFELFYIEGFDGPYLMRSSKERKWKVDMPAIPEELKKR